MKYFNRPLASVILLLAPFLVGQLAYGDVNSQLPGAIIQGNQNPFGQQPDSLRNLPESKKTDQTKPKIIDETKKPELEPSLTQKFHINKIEVQGVTRLSPKEIQSVISKYENTDVTLQDLQDNVTDTLTKLYEKKGYVTTLVYIPPQKINTGTLIVKADEGFVSQIVYEEGKYFKRRAVIPRLDLRTGEIFDLNDLQRSLRRINQNPDITLQATLKAGENPGETRVILKSLRENHTTHLTPFIDNLGRPTIGNTRYGATLNKNNVLGYGDTLYSNLVTSKSSFSTINGYELPLGSHGTKVGFSQAFTHFGFHRSGESFIGHSGLYTPYISQELKRTERFIASADLGFSVKNSEFDLAHTRVSEDRLRVLTPGISMQEFDRHGRTMMRHQAAIGLDMFHATTGYSPTTSRPGAGSQFVSFNGSVLRIQKLPFSSYAILKGLYQYSPDKLVSLQQFQAGGAFTVRGYSEGRVIGDSGFVLSAEIRMPSFFFPKEMVFPRTHYTLRDNVQLVAFSDFGGVFGNHPFSGVNAQSGRVLSKAYLGSVGVGLRAKLTRLITARLDCGFPILQISPGTQAARLSFGFESTLF